MTLEFRSYTREAAFHDPREDFEEVSVPVEIREDPLTGRQCRIVSAARPPPEEPDIEEFVSDPERCFFCPGTVEDMTPTYAGPMDAERGSVGEAVTFPNIAPYGEHSNVVVLTEDHHRPIDGFDAATFRDGLRAALEYVEAIQGAEPDAEYASVNMNYLPPAGSSIVHPHLQALVDDRGVTGQRRAVDAARAYYDEHGRPYRDALLEAERGGDRHVASTGSVDWLAPFAPKHFEHVVGVADEPGVPAPDADVVEEFAAGIANTLDYYADLGMNSFNVSLFAVADEPAFQPTVHLVTRSVFASHYVSDASFFTTLHDEAVIDTPPEEYAADVAERF